MGVPIYTRFVLAATKGASGRLDEGAEPGVRGEEGWIGDRRGEKEKERAVGLRCMGTHVCARVASYARDEQRETERGDDAIPAEGGEGWVANVRIVVGVGLNSLYYTA